MMMLVACSGSGDDDVTPDAAPPAFTPTEVTTLAMGEHGPNGIVVDETAVYFVAAGSPNNSIRKLDLTTRAVTTLIADIGKSVRIYGDADSLYYADNVGESHVWAASKADGGTRLLFQNAGDLVGTLAIDDTSVYWIGYDSARSKSVVHAVGKDGSGHHEIATMGSNFTEVVVDQTLVYGIGEDGIIAFDKATGAFRKIADAAAYSMSNLAQDASHIYWSNRSDNAIHMVGKTGGTATVIAANQPAPGRVTVGADGTVYWANRGTNDPGTTTLGSVMKLPPGAATPVVIASGLDHAVEPALLAHAVLWTVYGPVTAETAAGSVMAAPR